MPAGIWSARTWRDGAEVDCSGDDWAGRRAGFLGCGFRVVVPTGPHRAAALDRAHALVRDLADRLGAVLDEAPWQVLAHDDVGAALKVCGGWTHHFRAPLGACSTRVEILSPTVAPAGTPAGVTLPWQVNEHSPLTGLPALSAHHEARAARWLAERDGAEVGLWTNTAGHLVDTTAGTPLLHTSRGWRHPTRDDGVVPHHLWERACAQLDATAWRGPVPDDLDAVLCVAPDGRLTRLGALDGRPLAG